ncbi:hypothetical protein D3C72_1441650 [compost metagenome]
MPVPKIPSQRPPISSPRAKPSASSDYATDLFWVTLILQGVYLAGVYKKIELLHSKPVFYSLMLLPTIMFVVAKTWKSAFKYSVLCTFILPTIVSFIFLFAYVLARKSPNGGDFLPQVKQSFATGGTLGITLIVTIVPAVILGSLIRLCWNFFRRSK